MKIKNWDKYVEALVEYFRTGVRLPPPPPFEKRQPVSPQVFSGTTGFLFPLVFKGVAPVLHLPRPVLHPPDSPSFLSLNSLFAPRFAVPGGETTSPGQPGKAVFPPDSGAQGAVQPCLRATHRQAGDSGVTPVTPVYRRFYGSVKLDSLRVGRDAGRIADEVIQHLTKLVGAEVEVTLEIQARLPDGASDKTVRDVTENCRTLRFDSFDFEEE